MATKQSTSAGSVMPAAAEELAERDKRRLGVRARLR
jgi:hypothetical protein